MLACPAFPQLGKSAGHEKEPWPSHARDGTARAKPMNITSPFALRRPRYRLLGRMTWDGRQSCETIASN
jgi:hypothetical protein